MTKIGQIIEEEKQAYGKQMAEQAEKEAAERIAVNLLKKNMSAEEITEIVPGITLNEVKELEEKMLQTV